MKYFAPVDEADPEAPYLTGSGAPAVEGSIPPGEAMEHPQREIVNAITAAGLTPDEADLTQLLQALPLDIGFQAGIAPDGSGEDLAVQRYGHGVLARNTRFFGERLNAVAGPAGAAIVVDFRINGGSIYQALPEIAAGANAGTPGIFTAGAPFIDAPAGAYFDFFVLQVGSATPGQSLGFTLKAGGWL